MIILENIHQADFPLKWADLNSYRNSDSFRKEIYLKDDGNIIEELIFLFYTLFGKLKENLIIYDKSWWDFCLDTWNADKDQYDYEIDTKSKETQEYLKMLKISSIELGFSGCCKCKDWDTFLPIILRCIVSHQAPYSPIFCDAVNDFFFYFHYSGSIGLYYKNENNTIKELLENASDKYTLKS